MIGRRDFTNENVVRDVIKNKQSTDEARNLFNSVGRDH